MTGRIGVCLFSAPQPTPTLTVICISQAPPTPTSAFLRLAARSSVTHVHASLKQIAEPAHSSTALSRPHLGGIDLPSRFKSHDFPRDISGTHPEPSSGQ